MTPSTPAIPQIHGLKYTLDKIFEEGVENRHNRHARLNEMVHHWVEEKGFVLLPEKNLPPNPSPVYAITWKWMSLGLSKHSGLRKN
jgi:aspartate aminotransferase-like enzyme